MSILVMCTLRLSDWRALRELYAQRLTAQAYDAGGIHLRFYRNSQDAAEVLLVGEAPTATVARALSRMLAGQLAQLAPGGEPVERLWEPMRWAAGGGGEPGATRA